MLILAGELNTVNSITHFASINVLIDPRRVTVHLAMIMIRQAGHNCFSPLLASRRTGSVTILHPRHMPFPRRDMSFGRVNGGRPPKGINPTRETNDLRSGVNMSGFVISTVVVVAVVMHSD